MDKRILVCDDDPTLRQTLAALLRDAYEVREAANGTEALATVPRWAPGLVLLDVDMPGMSGLDVLRSLRESSPATTIVMISGKSQMGVVRRALQMGAKSYITKPFEADSVKREAALAFNEPERGPANKPWRIEMGADHERGE